MKVTCSICGEEMKINEPGGIEYILEENGDIHHVICN